MIEINEHNGIWELYVAGALYDYSPDLQTLPEILGEDGNPIPKDVGVLIICKHRDGKNNVNIPFRFSYNMAQIEDYNPDIPSRLTAVDPELPI